MKRSALLRRTELRRDADKIAEWRRRTSRPLPRRSQRQIRRQATLRDATEALEEWTGGRCQIRVPGVCTNEQRVAHHRRRRSQGGSDDISNLVLACRDCHGYVHRNVAWARSAGFLVRVGEG